MSLDKILAGELCEVTFRRRATNGEKRVEIVGDFNLWSPHTHHMAAVGDTRSIMVELVPGRTYRFRYPLDDARWENDWQADEYVDNLRGGQDSLVDLTAITPTG